MEMHVNEDAADAFLFSDGEEDNGGAAAGHVNNGDEEMEMVADSSDEACSGGGAAALDIDGNGDSAMFDFEPEPATAPLPTRSQALIQEGGCIFHRNSL